MGFDQYIAAATLGVGFIGLIVTQVTAWLSGRATARANSYLALETEAARVFEVMRQNPQVEHRLRETAFGPDAKADHEVLWMLPQILNLFEIAIRFNGQRIFERDVFATWVAWFFEVASYPNFETYWITFRPHYRPRLRRILDAGIETSRGEGSEAEKMQAFFVRVSKEMGDPNLPALCELCQKYGVPKIAG